MKIGNYDFDLVTTDLNDILNVSGVYVIICNENGKRFVIDVGESGSLNDRLNSHDREDCWKKNCKGELSVAIKYLKGHTESQRRDIESDLRTAFNPPCGKR